MAEEEKKDDQKAGFKEEEAKKDDSLDLKKVAEGDAKEEPKQEEAAPAPKKINLIYDALLLHSAGQEINEANVKKVADATGASVDESQIKALVAALDGVDITDAISKAAVAGPVAAPAGGDAASDAGAEKKEEKSAEEVEKKAEEAAEGLSSLFG